MTGKRLRSALGKVGAIIEKTDWFNTGGAVAIEYVAKLQDGKASLAWYEAGPEKKVVSLRTPYPDTNTSIQYNCFASKYHRTIKAALQHLLINS